MGTMIPAKVLADLQAAADNVAKGVTDPDEMARACEEMDEMREELRAAVGELDVAIDLIREARDEE